MAVESIFSAGDDALANQFEVIIPGFPGQIDTDFTSIRVTEFNVPETTIGTYEVNYKGQKFEKPSGILEATREFTFTFRVDKYWDVYKGFENWLYLVHNDVDGTMTPDVAVGGASQTRVDITVIPVDANGVQTSGGWTFTKAWIKGLAGASFSTDTGDPLTAEVTISFVKKVPIR